MEIVFLEKGSLGNDLDLSCFSELGHVTFYELTKPEEVPERIRDADVIIVNKIPMNEATLSGASHLKLVALTATGMNNIDFDYTNSHGIQVKTGKKRGRLFHECGGAAYLRPAFLCAPPAGLL